MCRAAGADAGTPYGAVVSQLVAVGFGLGLLVPVMTSSLLGSVDRSWSGVASGTLNTARQTGSVIGVALFGSLIAGSRGVVGGLHLALAISVVLVLAVLAAAIANETTRPDLAPDHPNLASSARPTTLSTNNSDADELSGLLMSRSWILTTISAGSIPVKRSNARATRSRTT